MHPALNTLRNALAYARFGDDDVRDATLNLVDELGTDLQPEYEPGTTVEEAVTELEGAMASADVSMEDIDAAIKKAKEEPTTEDDEPPTEGSAS